MTEIHLILAGIELGPYSEEQVRRYLTEGLARPSDRARVVGVDEWEPLEELLTHLPPPPPKRARVPDPLEDWELTFEPAPHPVVELFPEPEAEAPPAPPPEPQMKAEPPVTATGSLRAIRSTRSVAKARKRIITLNTKTLPRVPLLSPELPLTPPEVEPIAEPPPAEVPEVVSEEPPPAQAPEPVVEETPPPEPPPQKNLPLSRSTKQLPLPRRPAPPNEEVAAKAEPLPKVGSPVAEPILEPPPAPPPEIVNLEPPPPVVEFFPEPPPTVDVPPADLPPQKSSFLSRITRQLRLPKKTALPKEDIEEEPVPEIASTTEEPVPEPLAPSPSDIAAEEPLPEVLPEVAREETPSPIELPGPEAPPKKSALLPRMTKQLTLPKKTTPPEDVVAKAEPIPEITPPEAEPISEPPPAEPPEAVIEETPPPADVPESDVPPKKKTALLPRTRTQSLIPKGPIPPAAPTASPKAIRITGRAPLSLTGAARRKLQREEPRKGATAALEALRAASPVAKTELRSSEPAAPATAPSPTKLPAIAATRTKLLEALKKEPEAPPRKVEPKEVEPVPPPVIAPETPSKPARTTSSITGTIAKLLETSKINLPPKTGAPVPEKTAAKSPESPAPKEEKTSPESSVKAPPLAARTIGKLSDVARKPPESEEAATPAVENKPGASVVILAPEPGKPAVKPKPKTERLIFAGEEPLEDDKPAKTGALASPASVEKAKARTASVSKISSRPASESKVQLKPFSYTKTGRQPLVPPRRIKPAIYIACGVAAVVLVVVFVAYHLISEFGQTFGARAPVEPVSHDDTGGKAPAVQPPQDTSPKTSSDFYKRGTDRQTKGDLDGALADFNEALVLDPKNADAYSYRGFVEQAKGDVDAAVSDYSRSLELNPKNAKAFYNRGLIKSQHGDLDGAIADFDQALVINPKIAVAYYNRGLMKNQKNDLDGAITDFSQAIDFDPKLAGAYYNRGLANQAKGDLEPALNDYNQALSIDPNIAVAYYYRGLIKEQQSDLDGAIVDYDQALVLDPKNFEAYYNRGLAKQAKGDLDGSLKDLEKFCDSAPLSPYADYGRLYIWLVNSLQHEGKFADSQLSDSLRKQWNSSSSDFVTKIAAYLVGTMNEADFLAAAASSDSKKDQGQHCEAWYFAGMKRLMAKDHDTAVDYLNKCVATGERDYCEYISAQAELKRLQAVK